MSGLALSFAAPSWLWLLVALPILWFWPRRLEDMRLGLLRSLALTLIVLGLARPSLPGEGAIPHHVLLLDASRSAAAAASRVAAGAESMGAALGEASTTRIILSEATAAAAPSESWDRSIPLHSGATPLGDALTAAATAIPVGTPGSITLATDGHSLDEDGRGADWGAVVMALTARGIPVHVVPLESADGGLRPVAIDPEPTTRVGSATRVGVAVAGRGSATVELLAIDRAGEVKTLDRREDVLVDGRTEVTLSFEPWEAGFLPLVAVVSPADGAGARRALTTEIAVDDPLRVLYLGDRVVEGAPRLESLLGGGFSLESRGSLDTGSPALDRFDLVMLDDRPADTVPATFQEELVDAVRREGLGLVMSGGGGSFGPGGYQESPLASSLPVEFIQKEEKKDPSTALAIIIDTSGSMGGQRIILAKEVARLAIRRLLPHDKVGIVEFYGTKNWAAPLQSAANAIEIQRALNRLDAGGGTILLPAIEEAYYGLRNMQTRYKHVLVLTDAGVETGPYESLLRRMARDGICVSTVLVGPARHGEFLVQLADWGNGRYYNASDRFNLPEVMLKQPSTARLPGYRPGNHSVEPRGGRGWWGEVDPSGIPSLSGYVETRARPGAEVLVRTREEGHPVLASWRTGLGRVTTMTTEPVGPGTEGWQSWDDYGAFLARILTRTASDATGPWRFSIEADRFTVTVVAEQREAGAPAPVASRIEEGGARVPLRFDRRAPRTFAASFPRPRDGDGRALAARIEAGAAGGSRITRLVLPAPSAPELAGRASATEDRETQGDPAAALDLEALAAATGGSIAPSDLTGFRPVAGRAERAVRVRELASLCTLLALITYLIEILYRRRGGRRPAPVGVLAG